MYIYIYIYIYAYAYAVSHTFDFTLNFDFLTVAAATAGWRMALGCKNKHNVLISYCLTDPQHDPTVNTTK